MSNKCVKKKYSRMKVLLFLIQSMNPKYNLLKKNLKLKEILLKQIFCFVTRNEKIILFFKHEQTIQGPENSSNGGQRLKFKKMCSKCICLMDIRRISSRLVPQRELFQFFRGWVEQVGCLFYTHKLQLA